MELLNRKEKYEKDIIVDWAKILFGFKALWKLYQISKKEHESCSSVDCAIFDIFRYWRFLRIAGVIFLGYWFDYRTFEKSIKGS